VDLREVGVRESLQRRSIWLGRGCYKIEGEERAVKRREGSWNRLDDEGTNDDDMEFWSTATTPERN
jgi:hypothetical protein